MSRAAAKDTQVPEITTRLATASDAYVISKLIYEAFSPLREHYTEEAFFQVTPTPEVVATRFSEGPIWLALAGDTAVGTASAVQEPERIYIRSMAVLPRVRGNGVGGKMLAEIDKYASGEGIRDLYLYTTYFSPGAVRLYEKHGFVKVRDTPAEEWYGTAGIQMDKKLAEK